MKRGITIGSTGIKTLTALVESPFVEFLFQGRLSICFNPVSQTVRKNTIIYYHIPIINIVYEQKQIQL